MCQLECGKISIIVPVYNTEKYLRRCIESIIKQSYSNIELVLVDDGSKDSSGDICDSFARSDNRIIVIHTPNLGSAAARNAGLDVVTGEYLMFVDSDDWIESDACLTAKTVIDAECDDIVMFGVFSGVKPNITSAEPMGKFNRLDVLKCILSGETSWYSNRGYYVDALWGKIYKTQFIMENDIRFADRLIRSQDTVFSMYAIQLAKSVSFNTYKYYHYELNPDSICHTYSNKAVRIIPAILEENDRFIEKFYSGEEELAAANSMCIFPRFIEADRNYFFNESNPKQKKELFEEYKKVLNEPIVKGHIERLNCCDLNYHQKLKLLLYKHPSTLLYNLYSVSAKRK